MWEGFGVTLPETLLQRLSEVAITGFQKRKTYTEKKSNEHFHTVGG